MEGIDIYLNLFGAKEQNWSKSQLVQYLTFSKIANFLRKWSLITKWPILGHYWLFWQFLSLLYFLEHLSNVAIFDLLY